MKSNHLHKQNCILFTVMYYTYCRPVLLRFPLPEYRNQLFEIFSYLLELQSFDNWRGEAYV